MGVQLDGKQQTSKLKQHETARMLKYEFPPHLCGNITVFVMCFVQGFKTLHNTESFPLILHSGEAVRRIMDVIFISYILPSC